MGLFDSLFGRKDDQNPPQNQRGYGQQPYRQQGYNQQGYNPQASRPQNADEQAVARYRYMLQTAPPEEIEQAHAEAFARLTPEQRQMALQQMSQVVPESERSYLSDDPRALARAATRTEMRQPGSLERMFSNNSMGGGMGGMMGGGMMGGMGGMIAGSLLSSLAGAFIGSSIANTFFSHAGNEQAFQASPEAQAIDGGVDSYDQSNFEPVGYSSDSDPYGDPGAGNIDPVGYSSDSDPYGDPGADSGGFDTADFGGGDDFGGDFGDFGDI